jgi:hypothetical protein
VGNSPGAVAYASEAIDVPATLAWLFRDALLERIDAAIDAESDDDNAMTHEQRKIRTAEIQNDILATERDEAALVRSAMAQNLPVEFRADCSPIAVLGVVMIAVTNGHAPETSWQHAYDVVRGGR